MDVGTSVRLPRILTLLIIVLVAGLNPFSPIPLPNIHNVRASTRSVALIGNAVYGWNYSQPSGSNPTITITQGDTLMITTSQGDTSPHHFFVDIDGLGMTPDCTVDKCASVIPPTSTDSLTGFSAGTYNYYCEYHAAMKGTFIVQPASSSPDFTINAKPSGLNLTAGNRQASTLNVTSVNGFSGTVTLSPSAPTGIMATLNGSMVSLSSGASKFVALSVTVGASTSPGSYAVAVVASGGGNSHTANVVVTVAGPDFVISLDLSSLIIIQGSAGNVTVSLTSLNGFSGAVALQASVSPNGPTTSLSAAMVTLTAGGSATSKVTVSTISAHAGIYLLTVTGNGGSLLPHTTTRFFTVASVAPVAPIPAYVLAIAGVAILAAVGLTIFVVLRSRRPK